MAEVVEEDVAHLRVDLTVVDEEIAFEIVLEAPEIEIGGAGVKETYTAFCTRTRRGRAWMNRFCSASLS